MTIEYWVMKPANYEPGKKYPLVLEIHGGPTAMWGPGESSMWHEYQFFCSKGYGVVYCNPRGSGGYG
jgi:dipeptidyl aminopeptidase/acylaminoacyl peptidase